MKISRAFTIVEILVVVAISVILVALIFPIYKGALNSAKVTGSINNLRQQYVAFKIYQSNYDGGGTYGYWNQMGYPPPDSDWPRMLDPTLKSFDSPCDCHPSWPCPVTIEYVYYWPSEERPYASAFEEKLVLFGDQHCNSGAINLYNDFDEKRGVGVYVSGQIKTLKRRGDIWKFSWWAEPNFPINE